MVYLIVGLFMLLDLITGLVKAFKTKSFTSSIMREGLFHKCASVITVVLGVLVKFAQSYVDIATNVPICETICAYIVLMELGSIIENVGKINPKLIPTKLRSYFVKLE